jgi:hypothetical protein
MTKGFRSSLRALKQSFLKALGDDSFKRDVRHLLAALQAQIEAIHSLTRIAEERSRTLEYSATQSLLAVRHQIDSLHRLYVDLMPLMLQLEQRPTFNAGSVLELKTDHPVALESNDHISPDSTNEGVSRPTSFVQNCIRVLGPNIKCLDVGPGAGGLVFEYAMNQVLAVGIDGSDFCRINKVGYWPLLPNNLFTCDVTKPFSFLSRESQTLIHFDVVTMWEVLEHIAESDLPSVFSNINRHLSTSGYFIGSISLLAYVDRNGRPYHVTVKPKSWWEAKFSESGLTILKSHAFDEKSFCRGNGPRFQDLHNYAANPNDGFLFVAQKASC